LAEPLVLVTRPEPGAAETAARLAARGLRAVLAPALVLTPLHSPLLQRLLPPAQALLLPSRAAARAVAPSTIRVIAVGEATAEAARAQGFGDSYRFHGTDTQARRQIGNAVPPLLAYRLGQTLTPGTAVDLFAGAGGVGLQLHTYQEYYQWNKFATVLLFMFLLVSALDLLGERVRNHIVRKAVSSKIR